VGLTKRGKGSKVMLVVEGQGLPLGVLVESAQKAEVRLAEAALAQVKVTRPVGRPRTRPKELVADRGYDSEALRRRLRARGIKPCIPRRRNARPRRGRKPDLSGYRQRWVVERTFAWLGGFRRLLVRWERRAHIYLAFLLLACILILLRVISG
jgi:transposase